MFWKVIMLILGHIFLLLIDECIKQYGFKKYLIYQKSWSVKTSKIKQQMNMAALISVKITPVQWIN